MKTGIKIIEVNSNKAGSGLHLYSSADSEVDILKAIGNEPVFFNPETKSKVSGITLGSVIEWDGITYKVEDLYVRVAFPENRTV